MPPRTERLAQAADNPANLQPEAASQAKTYLIG
jgi:hypothetical protein